MSLISGSSYCDCSSSSPSEVGDANLDKRSAQQLNLPSIYSTLQLSQRYLMPIIETSYSALEILRSTLAVCKLITVKVIGQLLVQTIFIHYRFKNINMVIRTSVRLGNKPYGLYWPLSCIHCRNKCRKLRCKHRERNRKICQKSNLETLFHQIMKKVNKM